jgi:hypothetical protein
MAHTSTQCRVALDELGKHGEDFLGVETSVTRPSGCYFCGNVHQKSDCAEGAYFNDHVTGGTDGLDTSASLSPPTQAPQIYSGLQRICQTTGYTLETGVTLFVGDNDIDYYDTRTNYPGTHNVGVGGYTCENIANEISALITKFAPSEVVLVCGANDIANGATASTTATRFGTIVDALKASSIPTFTMSTKPEPASSNLLNSYQTFNTLVQSKAASVTEGAIPWLTVIDIYRGFVALGNSDMLYESDLISLSASGYGYWKTWLDTARGDKSWSSDGISLGPSAFESSCCLIWKSGICTQHAGFGCDMQNHCNGHGVCDHCTRTCKCLEGWGADTDVSLFKARDCSRRVCPQGAAFVDVPTGATTAHAMAECSNKGTCDFTTGQCICFEGFTGHACQRSACPNDCSGHGQCLSIREMATMTSALPLSAVTTYEGSEVREHAHQAYSSLASNSSPSNIYLKMPFW